MNLNVFRSKLLLFILGIFLFVPACSTIESYYKRPTSTPTTLPANVLTYQLKRGDITSTLQFSGQVVPIHEEPVYFQKDGRIGKLYTRAGEEVKKGQLLATFDALDGLKIERAEMELALRRAEINLEKAKTNQIIQATQTSSYTRNYQELMALEEYNVELAQIAYDEQKLQLEVLDQSIQNAQLFSPSSGKVFSFLFKEGDLVKAYEAVAILYQPGELEVGATLLPKEMEVLAEQMPCTAEISNQEGRVDCVIRQLPAPYGSANLQSGEIGQNNARITLMLPDGMEMKLNDLVNIQVVYQERKNALLLPSAFIRNMGGQDFVVVNTEAGLQRMDIATGLRTDDQVEVLSGVQDGDVIVAP